MEKISLNFHHLLPDLAPWVTLSGSNYPYLEQISMVQKMFEPLKFDCTMFLHNFLYLMQNRVDPNQTPSSAASDRSLYSLPITIITQCLLRLIVTVLKWTHFSLETPNSIGGFQTKIGSFQYSHNKSQEALRMLTLQPNIKRI